MITVRPAATRDIDALVRCSIGVGVESEGLEPPVEKVKQSITAALKDPSKARYFVAEHDGTLAGSLFVTYEWSDWNAGWYWWIQGVYVHPDHRGHGVYSALYDAVHAEAMVQGDVRRIRLYVDADNEAGIRAYEAHGMERTHYHIYDAPVGQPRQNARG